MEWIAAVQQAVVYMEEHLLEEINYEDVAKQVHISSYEFHRAFSFLSGMTANAYIRNRRLSLAGREIVETNARITDIALKYGYETPESFTKAFVRFHGVTPKMAREESGKLVLFNPIAFKITVEGGKSMDYRIVETKEQRFLAISRCFSNELINEEGNHDIPNFWDECFEKDLVEPLRALKAAGKKDLYGICSPAVEGRDDFRYGIGILLDDEKFDLKEFENKGFSLWNVEAGTYVVFKCIGSKPECVREMWARFYKEFLPQMGYEADSRADYEAYYQNRPEDEFCELWIPVKHQ